MLPRACIPHVPFTRALAIPTLRLAHTAALRHAPSLAPASPRGAWSTQRPRDALRTRSFATTPRRQAEEGPDMQAMFAQQRKLLQLLQERPEVLDHIKTFVELLKENGAF